MSLRHCSALLFLLAACATSAPTPRDQVVLPLPPVVEPIVLPAPIGLAPPLPIIVEPKGQLRPPQPEAASPPKATRPVPESQPSTQQEPAASPSPEPERSASNRNPPLPPLPLTPQRRSECEPTPTPHLGGDPLHNQCADKVPQNDVSGFDVLVNGKRFDALQLAAGVLWEVKTDNFDKYSADLRRIVIGKQVMELKRERDLASACGFDFRVGVRSAAHKAALEAVDYTLKIVVMDWC
jgi:hypothetical protein